MKAEAMRRPLAALERPAEEGTGAGCPSTTPALVCSLPSGHRAGSPSPLAGLRGAARKCAFLVSWDLARMF